jgi:glycosyltransferase involved in cell wall biosynthesis
VKIPLIYGLHSGQLYGTERMALATVEGLADDFGPIVVAPEGPIHAECSRKGVSTLLFTNPRKFALDIQRFFAGNSQLAVVGTRVLHSAIYAGWNRIYRRKLANVHIVHGGVDERVSYGRKHWLNRIGVRQVAVSDFVRDRLVANGVPEHRVSVIENFLSPDATSKYRRRDRFEKPGIRRIAVVSRIDPIKRIDLLVDAIELHAGLRDLEIRLFGTGWQLNELRERAARSCRNVQFLGFRENVPDEIANSDLLLHLCPEEPFGLVVLEAMAVGVPVMVPNSGGAGDIIIDERNGFRFRANDVQHLAARLIELKTASADRLNRVVANGFYSLESRFSAEARLEDYRRVLKEVQ